MVGRRRARASSNSTVATVDEQTIIYTKENQIIKPAPPGTKPDDWECFLLTEAVVYNRHGEMANLLHVDIDGPFMIRGLMVVEPDQSKSLVRGFQRIRQTWIEISRTYAYSFGTKESSGTPVLWAAGEAAHFEIIPSDKYTPIATIMFQGIMMHYTILDLYEAELDLMLKREHANSKDKKRRPRLQDVKMPLEETLFRYTAAVGDGSTLEEVLQRCKDQAPFLLVQFPREVQFHAWLSSQFPEIVQQLKRRPSPSAKITFTEPPIDSRPASDRQKSSTVGSRSKRKAKAGSKDSISRSSRGKSNPHGNPIESGSEDQPESRSRSAKAGRPPQKPKRSGKSELEDVDMQDFGQKPLSLPARTKDATASATATATSTAGSSSALSAVIDTLNDERRVRLDAWNSGSKQKKHPDQIPATSWQTQLYMGLSISNYGAKSEIMLYHAAGMAKSLGPEWHDSELYKWAKQNANKKPKYEHITEAQILKIQRRQKMTNGRSQTQTDKIAPRPSETSGKQPPRGRPSGKAAGLRPSLGSKKRPRSEDDDMDLDDDSVPRRKTARASEYFSNDEVDGEVDTSPASEDENEDDDDEDESDAGEGALTRIVVHAEPLPSLIPKGPNHTWICEEPDCGYIVRSAHDEEGQKLIRHHYEEHEQEASDVAKERELGQINLAMQESRGHLPINNLLDKIRKAKSGPNKSAATELNGQVIPQPIKRSLLI